MATPSRYVMRVVRTEDLTPHLRRVVVTGDRIAEFPDNGCTDRYVKLVFGTDERPIHRTYTLRRIDHTAGELWIDFVLHGDDGVAGPWAAAAVPGDELLMSGPGGAYSPSADTAFHLLVGDEAALPAIAAALEAMTPDARGLALLEVEHAGERLPLEHPAGVEVRWLHRADGAGDDALLDALRAVELPPVGVQAFVHGELHLTRAMAKHLRDDRGVTGDALSASGYWRRGKTEDGFQAEKRELMAADRAASST